MAFTNSKNQTRIDAVDNNYVLFGNVLRARGTKSPAGCVGETPTSLVGTAPASLGVAN